MREFSETEIEQIRKALKQYCKENKEITEGADFVNVLRDCTDFYNEQYRVIQNTIEDFIRYNDVIKSSNVKEFIEELEEIEQKEYGVFTRLNVIVSAITAIILFFIAVETNNVLILIVLAYMLLWAYLGRYVGLKKGIDTGYAWGYCLGIIGFIVVCVLQGEKEEETTSSSNKYEDLERLQKLKESGAITDEEFESEKSKLLK